MSDMNCLYPGDRDQAIVSYLYGDDAGFNREDRASFETHLTACGRCREEIAAFDSVRASLGEWSPPAFESMVGADEGRLRMRGAGTGRAWWHEMPIWAQTAAALLFVGVAAGAANLDVRYDADGLRVRTGWLAAPGAAESGASSADATGGRVASQADLTALEERIRADVRGASAAAAAPPSDGVPAETIRRVRALVAESERRQQRELALRLAEAMREVSAQRQADLVRIDRNIGAMQNSTGLEMLRQRNEMLVRTASQRAR